MTAEQRNGWVIKGASALLVGILLYFVQNGWSTLAEVSARLAEHEKEDAQQYVTRQEFVESLRHLEFTIKEAMRDAGRSPDRPR